MLQPVRWATELRKLVGLAAGVPPARTVSQGGGAPATQLDLTCAARHPTFIASQRLGELLTPATSPNQRTQRRPATPSRASRRQSAVPVAGMDPEIAVTNIESLPDPLLGKIFATAGRQEGVSAACPYCCRCWCWLCCREPRLPPLSLLLLLLAVSCC